MAISVPTPSGSSPPPGWRRSPSRSRGSRRRSWPRGRGRARALRGSGSPPLRRGPSRRGRRRTAGRPPRGRLASCDIWSRRLIRTRLSGWIFESAPPVIITSARPRAMIRAASPIARFEAASASVIVLLGPWQSSRIEMWQASMFGRYFSSQIGGIMRDPLAAVGVVVERRRSTRKPASIAAASSSSSVEIRPAPRSTPIRVGSTPAVGQPGVERSPAPRRRRRAGCPGPCTSGSWRAAFLCLGRASRHGLRVEAVDLGRRVVGQALDGERPIRPTPPRPSASDAQTARRPMPSGVTRPSR